MQPSFYLSVFLFFGNLKQAISIQLATSTMIGHFYVTVTLQTFVWIAHLFFFLFAIFFSHSVCLLLRTLHVLCAVNCGVGLSGNSFVLSYKVGKNVEKKNVMWAWHSDGE